MYEEGALIFPAVQIQRDYEDIEDIVRMCRLRIRVPDQWWGDYLAALGAARIGERETMSFGNEIGWDTLAQFAEQWFDYSEQLMIAAVRKMPGGRAVTTSMHDPFPNAEDGIPVKIVVDVDPEEAMIDIDLRDNPDAMPCGLNLSRACCESTLLLGVFNSIPDAVPTNTGSFRRVRMHLRENCVAGIPKHPTSCSVATTNLADRVGNGVSRAIADLGDGYGMASTGSIIPPSLGVISGTSEKTKGAYVNQIFLGWGGGAAGAHADAWLSIGHLGNAGMSYQDSIELDEMRFPLTVRGRHFITDSGGHGRTRGGAGVYCEFGPTDGDLEVGYVSDGNVTPPEGARGGTPGGRADQFRRDANGDLHHLDPCAQAIIPEGHTIVSYSCGGGGYGAPTERPAAQVAIDVRERWVSPEAARDLSRGPRRRWCPRRTPLRGCATAECRNGARSPLTPHNWEARKRIRHALRPARSLSREGSHHRLLFLRRRRLRRAHGTAGGDRSRHGDVQCVQGKNVRQKAIRRRGERRVSPRAGASERVRRGELDLLAPRRSARRGAAPVCDADQRLRCRNGAKTSSPLAALGPADPARIIHRPLRAQVMPSSGSAAQADSATQRPGGRWTLPGR